MSKLGGLFRRKVSNDLDTESAVKTDPVMETVSEVSNSEEEQDISDESIDREDFEDVKRRYSGFDREHIWAFTAGQSSQDFRGNPKYLFVYINRYRPDIKAYWFCDDEETIAQVRSINMDAYANDSLSAQYLFAHTGVVVAEQVKALLPELLNNIKYLNVWHGVGFKRVERGLFEGDISMGLARKYIDRGTFYRDNQLAPVPSRIVEQELMRDLGLDEDQFVHAGYTRCLYQKYFDPVVTYNHDIRKEKGLSPDTRLVVYAPTYRAKLGGTFVKGIPDFERLYQFCEKNNILFIFKVHPNMEKEVGFLKAWETFGDRPHFLFWDNRNDFYEIMHTMDLAIVDYSAIISDMIAMGIPHYIRYLYDYDEYMSTVDVHDNYFEITTGRICKDFDALLEAMEDFEAVDESADIERLNQMLWEYSGEGEDFDKIIQETFDFKPKKRTFPILYSFDIFDTLFSRKVLDPQGVFYRVKEKMLEDGSYPRALVKNYPATRHMAEMNVREYYNKSILLRGSDRVEIQFEEIIDRIADVYPLNEKQIAQLKEWELETELDNVVPLTEQIELVKKLLSKGEKVILISDMYLPKWFVKKLLKKADPVLESIPLFLSSEYGVLKTSRKLFFEVYKSFKPFYDFEKWIHYGDNVNADQTQARRFRIQTRRIEKPVFNEFQKALVKELDTYDGFLIAAMQARLCQNNLAENDEFVISFVSLCFVPYIDWAIRDAMRRGYQTLYFVSRDGHHLKRIADEIIRYRELPIKTKYIYGSRRCWWIPSFVDEVDHGFFEGHGAFVNIYSKEKLLHAMHLNEEKFHELFPYINLEQIDFTDRNEFSSILEIFENSNEYHAYLLDLARSEREIVGAYLKQEIDPSESYAFVEYNGRGYTQDCFARLWGDVIGEPDIRVAFYYSRSILPTAGQSIRHNFTVNNGRQYFIESIFANMPYKSIESFELVDGKLCPVIEPISYDEDFFASMNELLPEIALQYAKLDLKTPEDTARQLYDFLYLYYNENLANPEFAEQIGHLVDSVALYGDKRPYAPPYTEEQLDLFQEEKFRRDSMAITTSMSMSYARSNEAVQQRYNQMYQITPGKSPATGFLLNEEQQEKNEIFRERIEDLIKHSEALQASYQETIPHVAVEQRILIVIPDSKMRYPGLKGLRKALKEQDQFTFSVCSIKQETNVQDMAKKLARARYIIIDEPIELFCKLKLRKETDLILLPQIAFTIRRDYLENNARLFYERKYYALAGRNPITVLQVPSDEQENAFRRRFCNERNLKTDLRGNCMTDALVLLNKKESALKKIHSLFPAASGKKILLYMPEKRFVKENHHWVHLIDLEYLQKKLGENWCVLVHFPSKTDLEDVENTVEIPEFSKDFSGKMSIWNLMQACDAVAGDYRAAFFHMALLRKPAFFTADDFETRVYKRRNTNDIGKLYEKMVFGPVVNNAEQLADCLNDIHDYDYTEMDAFKETMFADCDGRSTERVISYMIDNC